MIWLFHCFTSSVGRIIYSFTLIVRRIFSIFILLDSSSFLLWILPRFYILLPGVSSLRLNDISLIHLSYVYHVNHTITLKKRKFYLFFIYLPDAYNVLGSTWTSKCMSMVISFVVVFVVYIVSEYKNQNIHHVKWI